jgi:hypothetical protein
MACTLPLSRNIFYLLEIMDLHQRAARPEHKSKRLNHDGWMDGWMNRWMDGSWNAFVSPRGVDSGGVGIKTMRLLTAILVDGDNRGWLVDCNS